MAFELEITGRWPWQKPGSVNSSPPFRQAARGLRPIRHTHHPKRAATLPLHPNITCCERLSSPRTDKLLEIRIPLAFVQVLVPILGHTNLLAVESARHMRPLALLR